MKLLAQQEGVEVQEWVNPVTEVHQLSTDDPAASRGSRQVPQAAVFRDFLLRASQFSSLCLTGVEPRTKMLFPFSLPTLEKPADHRLFGGWAVGC